MPKLPFTLLTAALLAASPIVATPLSPTQASSSFVHRENSRSTPITDAESQEWSARSGFTRLADRSDGLSGKDVRGTTNDLPYQSNLYGLTGYSLKVPPGKYRIRLLMAEDYFNEAGRRVFDVVSEGTTVLEDIDIARAVGRGAAYDRNFVTVVADGTLDLGFRPRANKALISAIEVIQIAPIVSTSPSPTPLPVPPSESSLQLSPLRDVEWAGLSPIFAGNTISTRVGGGDARSEVFWETPKEGRIRLPRKSTVTAEFDVRQQLQNATTDALPSKDTWHVLFQLLGPTEANTWPGPPFSVAWQNGTYRIGGGAAVPDSNGKLQFKGTWFTPYPQAPLNTWRNFKITTYIDGPGSGWVSLWIDGRQILDEWKPLAGTFYTGAGRYSHKDIQIKTGLYTGTNSPAWSRSSQHRNIRLTWVVGAVTKTAGYNGS